MVRSTVFRKEEGEQRGSASNQLVSRIASLAYPRLPKRYGQ
jgi:hypothetical protein